MQISSSTDAALFSVKPKTRRQGAIDCDVLLILTLSQINCAMEIPLIKFTYLVLFTHLL